jgi:hypothetical protein
MKIEEARETLKHIGEHIKVHDEHGLIYSAQLVGALEIADAAMEKQIPKEPNGKCEYLKFKSGYCPNCSTSVCGIDAYCPACGQRLKWE